ncbi:MAG: hypothetical protein A2Z94_06850 [Gallionellales bacterium GWA2_55_18]|nr:MAG: hypothetical protein A2Z94_06850 [Gallionellales bacterium GWA2_55_18]
MKSRILFLLGSLLVICNSHAKSPSEPLIVGVTAPLTLKIETDKNVTKCNVEILIPGIGNIEKEITSPNYEAVIEITPQQEGQLNIQWKGKTKFRGFNTTPACAGTGSIVVTATASKEQAKANTVKEVQVPAAEKVADASSKNSTTMCKVLDQDIDSSYSGGCKDGLAHGEGVFTVTDGATEYRGMFVVGKFHGKGTLTEQDGKFVGDWVAGKFHGKGTFTGSNVKYVGDWVAGKFHGKGTLTTPSGEKYVGDFVGGKFHGKGTFTGSNGKYVGDWVAGKFHGKGTLTEQDGRKHVGSFVDGKFQGEAGEEFQGKASDDTGSLFSLAGNPLLTPDSQDYKGDVRIDANENSLIRVQSELMGIQERRNPRYVYLKLTKKTINHAPNSMRIGATISVIGKYVKNINYRTVGGETKTAPVIECSYLGKSNGEESKGMLEQMIKLRESRSR